MMNADFCSRIRSETKTFTVMALPQFADQAMIHIDDSIVKYVDGILVGRLDYLATVDTDAK